jgi:hypothetical protein
VTWDRTRETDERVEWERADGYARVAVRETATGAWAVALDRLEQAPEGEAYRHETVADRAEAVETAEQWRRANDIE